jgi:hypothetical protein
LGGARQRLVRATMAVSAEVQRATNIEAFRYGTLLTLLRCPDLRLISVWHPSFLSLLLEPLPRYRDSLLADIERGGCAFPEAFGTGNLPQELSLPLPRRSAQLGRFDFNDWNQLWPELQLISCWASGSAELNLRDLRQRFPDVTFQPKGLIATEAFVSLPFQRQHPVAVTSHFFEFKDRAAKIHLVDDLQVDEEYEVIVTTSGGLWRYGLGDRVRVTGFAQRTPCLGFLGRVGDFSDLCGEKLSEEFVAETLKEVFGETSPAFALLAPERDGSQWRYVLYVEGKVQAAWATALDGCLRRNPHYAYCRDLGQLRPIELFEIAGGGYQQFVARQGASGTRLGDIKPAALSNRSGWSSVFSSAPGTARATNCALYQPQQR